MKKKQQKKKTKKRTELASALIFTVIVIGQAFLAIRYAGRDDTVGLVLFAIVAILAAIAAIGHFIEWRKVRIG